MTAESTGREAWGRVEDLLGNLSVELGAHWSYNLRDDPKRLAFVLSRYKFAAKMIGRQAAILELGCSEGLAGQVLAEHASRYVGVDADGEAIAVARRNWTDPKCRFLDEDFMGKSYGAFDAIVSMDVIEHIEPDQDGVFWETVHRNLGPRGMCVLGTPNLTAAVHASAVSRANHVNLYDAERLRSAAKRYFGRVFLFGMNDEVLHTGFPAMAHFLIVVGCLRRDHPQ